MSQLPAYQFTCEQCEKNAYALAREVDQGLASLFGGGNPNQKTYEAVLPENWLALQLIKFVPDLNTETGETEPSERRVETHACGRECGDLVWAKANKKLDEIPEPKPEPEPEPDTGVNPDDLL